MLIALAAEGRCIRVVVVAVILVVGALWTAPVELVIICRGSRLRLVPHCGTCRDLPEFSAGCFEWRREADFPLERAVAGVVLHRKRRHLVDLSLVVVLLYSL